MAHGPRFIYTARMSADRPVFDMPDFLTDGRGRCSDLPGNVKDKFTETSTRAYGQRARDEAAVHCGLCPFARECAAWAQTKEQDGVWGGVWFKKGKPANKREEVRLRDAA